MNTKFCVKLEKNASDTCAMHTEACEGESYEFLSSIYRSKSACISKS
jgi:hypothetical protein